MIVAIIVFAALIAWALVERVERHAREAAPVLSARPRYRLHVGGQSVEFERFGDVVELLRARGLTVPDAGQVAALIVGSGPTSLEWRSRDARGSLSVLRLEVIP